jgi:D-alanine--poly(phosphoribitol) ligase subunit 1
MSTAAGSTTDLAPSSTSDAPALDVLTAVLQHAVADGTHPAAKDDAIDLDYAQLRSTAAELAAGLLARGVEPGDRVALELPNSVDFLIAALACLWVGAIFVPLAVSDPRARLDSIIDDCDPRLVLTTLDREDPHERSATIADIRVVGAEPAIADPTGLAAYAIYTSGTTGTPKGVIIGRAAFATAVGHTVRSLGMDQTTRALCVSPFHFDGSFGTLFPAVVAGAALVIPRRDALLFARYFFRILTREQITHTGFSSTYLRLLLASPHLAAFTTTPDLTVALGGEACSAADVVRLWETKPNTRVFNRYGPTETTIAVTHFEVTRAVIDRGGPVPIGQPHPDTTFYLIDSAGAVITAAETVGELYIGGPQVMDYYWNAPALTAEAIDTVTVAGERLYRSGDLMRRTEGDDYIYVDRVNRVIKRNAVRISLIELTEALCTLPDVTAAVCSTFDNSGDLGIVAFVVSNSADSPQDVRVAAARSIPATMLPDTFVLVDTLPLTSSSKVDERRLLAEAGLTPN